MSNIDRISDLTDDEIGQLLDLAYAAAAADGEDCDGARDWLRRRGVSQRVIDVILTA